jgi:hypothetical protein
VIVSPRPSHAAGIDVIGYDVAVVAELFIAENALAVLGHNLLVQQLSHFRIRADLPISARVLGIVDATDSHLSLASFFWDRFSAAAELGAVNRAELISAESHGFLQLELVRIKRFERFALAPLSVQIRSPRAMVLRDQPSYDAR